jgi:hypothetical protein
MYLHTAHTLSTNQHTGKIIKVAHTRHNIAVIENIRNVSHIFFNLALSDLLGLIDFVFILV